MIQSTRIINHIYIHDSKHWNNKSSHESTWNNKYIWKSIVVSVMNGYVWWKYYGRQYFNHLTPKSMVQDGTDDMGEEFFLEGMP